MPPGPLAGVPKARKPKGAKSPAGRSEARRAEGAEAVREVFPRPRGKSALLLCVRGVCGVSGFGLRNTRQKGIMEVCSIEKKQTTLLECYRCSLQSPDKPYLLNRSDRIWL